MTRATLLLLTAVMLLTPAAHARTVVTFDIWMRNIYDFSAPRVAWGDLNEYDDGSSLTVELHDYLTPQTVDNFLQYVNNGDYTETMLSRFARDFVVQGGGYYANPDHDPNDPANDHFYNYMPSYGNVENEYARPNFTGTIAMAKSGAIRDPNTGEVIIPARDTASNQWFFNLKNNADVLDPEDAFDPDNPDPDMHGGYTVFGRVTDETLDALLTINHNYYQGRIGAWNPDNYASGDFTPVYWDPNTDLPYAFEVDVTVTTEAAIPGDANRDGAVTDADYTIWADNFGTQEHANWEQGDFNHDGQVTDADYTVWADHFGETTATPEPASLAALTLAAAALFRRRR